MTMQFYATSSDRLLGYLRTSVPSAHTSWFLGVMLSLIASFAGALGDNLVRLSFVKERERRTLRSLCRRPPWLLGFFLSVIVNPVLTLLALKFAAAAIVLPFGGMHIFWNVLLVGYLLQEKLHIEDIFGSLCILTGIFVVIYYGPHEVPPVSLSSLSSMVVEPAFKFYLLIEAICVVICLVASTDFSDSSASSSFFSSVASPQPRSLASSSSAPLFSPSNAPATPLQSAHSTHTQHQAEQTEALTATSTALLNQNGWSKTSNHSGGVATESAYLFRSGAFNSSEAASESAARPPSAIVGAERLSALATAQQHVPVWIRRFSLPVLSGIFGGLGNLAAKGLIEHITTHGLHQSLWSSEFSVCLFATLLFCSLQLLYLNLALFRHEAKHAVPVVNATLIASGSLGGLLLFKEFVSMSSAQVTVFAAAILLVIGGIAILASAPCGAVSKASQADLFAGRLGEVDGTDEERQAARSVHGYTAYEIVPHFVVHSRSFDYAKTKLWPLLSSVDTWMSWCINLKQKQKPLSLCRRVTMCTYMRPISLSWASRRASWTLCRASHIYILLLHLAAR